MEGDEDGRGHIGKRKQKYDREEAAMLSSDHPAIDAQGLLKNDYLDQRHFGTDFHGLKEKERNHECIERSSEARLMRSKLQYH